MKLRRPPKYLDINKLEAIFNTNQDEYEKKIYELESKATYLSYSEIFYRSEKLNHECLWYYISKRREIQRKKICNMGVKGECASYSLTSLIQSTTRAIDINTTNSALELMSQQIGEAKYFTYLINDLIEDESISSSQLEGAATTTLAAKNMLKINRKPRDEGEKMILGNFKMMKYVWDRKSEDLTIEFLKDLHKVGVDGINDDVYHAGELKHSNDVAVVDSSTNDVIHYPPPLEGLEERLNDFFIWINTNHNEANDYIHPLIKAIVLHFFIGYEHPFQDGNGRVARALFYWFMFKNEYPAFRFINISKLIKSAPRQYVRAYQLSEWENLDLTYFIEHQCKQISLALKSFIDKYDESYQDVVNFNHWFVNTGLYEKLNTHQKTILHVAKSGLAHHFTARSVQDNLEISYNTAASALKGLESYGLFSKHKKGKTTVYIMRNLKSILKSPPNLEFIK